jgi:hypothetical protein
MRVIFFMCRRGDSNPHSLRHTPLKRACLPISPLRQVSVRIQGAPVRLDWSFVFGAQDWTRTSTPVKALPPQSSVSTNFTTWAFPSPYEVRRATKVRSFSALSKKAFK